ncbi:MAG: hypothetical protein ACRDD3_01085 [Azovibrio sp.]
MAQTKDQMKKYDDWFLFEDGRGNVESLIGFRHEDGTLSALHRVCNPAIIQCPWVFSPGSEVTCKKTREVKYASSVAARKMFLSLIVTMGRLFYLTKWMAALKNYSTKAM